MNNLLLQAITVVANLEIFIFVLYYIWRLRQKEKELEKKEGKIDFTYHQIVDNALTRERKILEDATQEADQIIVNAEYVNQESKDEVDAALHKMMTDIQKETLATAQKFIGSYQESLKDISHQSINDFQSVSKQMQDDLKAQIKMFHENLLPNLQKEVDEYKKTKMQQVDTSVTQIIQKVSQEVFNQTISLEEHHKLLADSLDKAKKEGIFD
ncbi:MAG: hypothetical protein ACM3IJ_04830 [Candidatus Levyibacteriota bacterium]